MRISNTMSASSTFSASVASGSRGDAARANRRTQEPTLTNNRTIRPTMNKAKATKIIIAERKAILVHGEPLTRILDDCVRASVMVRHPAIKQLRNDTNRGINVGNGQFDIVLGVGSVSEVAGMIQEFFNMG